MKIPVFVFADFVFKLVEIIGQFFVNGPLKLFCNLGIHHLMDDFPYKCIGLDKWLKGYFGLITVNKNNIAIKVK